MKNIKLVNLRALAIIFVVLGHSIILYYPGWGYFNTVNKEPILEQLKNIINLIQMPLFFSISGYLFVNSIKKKRSNMKFIKNKFKRLITPFFIIGLFWMISIRMLIKYQPYQSLKLIEIIKLFLIGKDTGHLWYLVTLFLIFIVMYSIKNVLKKNNYMIDLLMYIMFYILGIIANKYEMITYIKLLFSNIIYFYIGILLNKYEDKLNINNKYIAIALIILINIIALLLKNIYINYILACLLVFLIYNITPTKTNKMIEKIDKNSFGIYLFHSPLVYITYTYLTNYHPIIVIFINFVIFGIIAYLLTAILKKTKLKFIVGE